MLHRGREYTWELFCQLLCLLCHGQSNLSVGDNKYLCSRQRFNCFYCGATICFKQLDINLIMYSNIKSTGLPLGLFSTLIFF